MTQSCDVFIEHFYSKERKKTPHHRSLILSAAFPFISMTHKNERNGSRYTRSIYIIRQLRSGEIHLVHTVLWSVDIFNRLTCVELMKDTFLNGAETTFLLLTDSQYDSFSYLSGTCWTNTDS